MNGCNSKVIGMDNGNINYNYDNYEIHENDDSVTENQSEDEMVYCVDQDEFNINDLIHRDNDIDGDKDEQLLAGFDDDSSFSD